MKVEGYWRAHKDDVSEYPFPESVGFKDDVFVEKVKSLQEKARVIQFKGFSFCRICECINGTQEFEYKGWNWPSGYLHYIVDHGVKPSDEFYDFVMKN